MAKKKTVSNKAQNINVQSAKAIMSLNASLLRSELLTKLLNPGIDINYECRYPDSISKSDYKDMYDRNGLAERVVKIMPEESWAVLPDIYENEESDETEFEKSLNDLIKQRRIFHYLKRVDILSGIGRYGLLLMGINDGKELSEPVEGIDLNTGEKRGKVQYELLYLKPFSENSVSIELKETSKKSPRYGFPTVYNIDFDNAGIGTDTSKETLRVHYTRVIHVADNREESDIYGKPRMKAVYNNLLDVRKVLGGSGEMFWRGAFPGYTAEVDPEVATELTPEQKTVMKEELRQYAAGLQRYLTLSGIKIKALAPQVADPTNHIEAQIKSIAITKGIPYRIFIGTEEAKLAGTQDAQNFVKRIKNRQEHYLSPMLIRPFIDRLMAYGVLPEPKETIHIFWPDLTSPSEKEKSEVVSKKTEAMAKYVTGGVDSLISPQDYWQRFMGMTPDESMAIEKGLEEYQTGNMDED